MSKLASKFLRKMIIQYSIPTYRRPMQTRHAVQSVYKASPTTHVTHCIVTENGYSPGIETLKELEPLMKSMKDKIVYIPVGVDISPCHNWLLSLSLGSAPIVKLLFSDDALVQTPSETSLRKLLYDSDCAAVVSPVTVDLPTGKSDGYILSRSHTDITSREYMHLMLTRWDKVPLSPSAYYFRQSDFISALAYCLSIKCLKPCIANGAGIDSLTILTLLCRPNSYVLYDSEGLTLFGAGPDSFTISDIESGARTVSQNRNIAHKYLMDTGIHGHFEKYSTFRAKHYA